MTEYKTKRMGAAYLWEMETDHSLIRGRTTDNLDKRPIDSAIDKFEWAFILLREVASENESLCMDSEEDRLTLCQSFAEKFRGKKFPF
tara:strand:- start:1237 stop:1500 length:264 start_codon:yes stop_codon:yes gene_type:complete